MPDVQDIPTAILNAATRRFSEHGYDGTSIAKIAADVGIRKPSLLYHFASKDELRAAVVARMFDHWRALIPDLLATATTGDDRFDRLVGAVVEFFQEDPHRARLIARELLDRPAVIGGLLDAVLGPWIALLADYIQRGQREGAIYPDVDPRVYVLHVIQLVIGATAASPALSKLIDPDTAHARLRSETVRIARASLFIPDTPRIKP